ncbi:MULTISPECIES: hypothetical protein [Hymenobacter]|uniref:Uncharacterized protein n=1 Tax=Hymenobacter mucosus TaxID=1411120 RepID=A0A238VK33_9BACT|nr:MULTISPECIES: hypothetical protein [Hymenobacter]SNR34760.1 hypothetical protein SAMN06269173_101797 [Hymenobacter mucosus]
MQGRYGKILPEPLVFATKTLYLRPQMDAAASFGTGPLPEHMTLATTVCTSRLALAVASPVGVCVLVSKGSKHMAGSSAGLLMVKKSKKRNPI